MKDKFNREIDYLRISVTENCNLRCIYCTEDDLIHSEDYLSRDEIYKIVKECSDLGIKKIRITGGEPLFRKDILEIFEKLNQIELIEEKYITTNGIYLEENLEKLKEYGLTGVNISIDSLKEDIFKTLTKSNNLKRVLSSVDKALKLDIKVKINVVLIENININEINDFVEFTKDKKVDVRFIELMPIGLGKRYKGISNKEVKEIIEKNFDIEKTEKEKRSGPANYIKIKNYLGKIGFISAMSNCFCGQCNRVRLTSSGFLKKCLHYNYGVDLKKAINKNENLKEIIREAIYDKPEKHDFNEIELIDKSINKNKLISKNKGKLISQTNKEKLTNQADKEEKLMNQIGG